MPAVATAVAGAGAATGATIAASATATSVIKEVVATIKDIGKVVLKSVVDIAKLFADPMKGLPVAIVLYLGAKQVNIDVSAVEQQIDLIISQAKSFNFASKVDQSVKSWLASFLNITPDVPFYELLNPVTIWNAIDINLPPIVDIIAKSVMFIPISSIVFALGAVVGFSYLAYYVYCILLDTVAIMSKVAVRFYGTAINYLFQFVTWIACSYIKIVQPILPLMLAFRFAHSGLKTMVLSSALGTITAYVALYMLVPECTSIAVPGAPTTPVQPPSLPAPGEELAKVIKVDFESYSTFVLVKMITTILGVVAPATQVSLLSAMVGVVAPATQVRLISVMVGIAVPAVAVA